MLMQLTDAQRSVLEPACSRDDRCVFPITASLTGGAIGNVCKSLLGRGLLEEVPASDTMTVWRHDATNGALTLSATEAGQQVIRGAPVSTTNEAPAHTAARATPSPAPPLTKETRQDALLCLLRRPTGATLADMAQATGWQPHSVRGALSGVIGKKLGLTVISTKLPGEERVFKVG
jgi:hypothetical protein